MCFFAIFIFGSFHSFCFRFDALLRHCTSVRVFVYVLHRRVDIMIRMKNFMARQLTLMTSKIKERRKQDKFGLGHFRQNTRSSRIRRIWNKNHFISETRLMSFTRHINTCSGIPEIIRHQRPAKKKQYFKYFVNFFFNFISLNDTQLCIYIT